METTFDKITIGQVFFLREDLPDIMRVNETPSPRMGESFIRIPQFNGDQEWGNLMLVELKNDGGLSIVGFRQLEDSLTYKVDLVGSVAWINCGDERKAERLSR